jgi:hypothetical protein
MAVNLKLENFSDRELLYIISDLTPASGWVDVDAIAARVGIAVADLSDEQLLLHARRCVSVRLAWIRKLSGCVERNPDETLSWGLTYWGQTVVKGKLSNVVSERIAGLSEADSLKALDLLSRKYLRAEANAANLMRREWAYGTHRNRRG